jgi:hypothetical protein
MLLLVKTAGRISAGADWLVDVLLPHALIAALAIGWLATAAALFLRAPWWAGVLALVVGIPFAIAVANAVTED